MIDRRAFWIFILLFLAMTAGAVWRVSLLPGWRLSAGGLASHHGVSGLFVTGLFAAPASLLTFMVTPFLQWLTSPKETLPFWRRWSGKWIISWSVLMALMQTFVLASSLGLVSLPGIGGARVVLVYIGITFMILGNAAPKAPSRPQKSNFELDPWRQNQMLRFVGKLLFGLGLAFAMGGLLLPLELWARVFFCLMLSALVAGIWYGIKLRHERSLAGSERPH